MSELTQLDHQVLNAAVDDYESLEQIYRSLALEFSAENYNPSDPTAFYWREAERAPSLAEIADAITRLTTQGLLEARTEVGSHVTAIDDPSIVWNGWFHTTDRGRQLLDG
jgi:hypothetical protein